MPKQSAHMTLTDAELHRYARQLILPKFSDAHQLALKSAHVLVIGAGGLGVPALQYLVGAGVGVITIIDDDDIELTNLNRQMIYPTDTIGLKKADTAKAILSPLNPEITIHSIDGRFSLDNAEAIICESTPSVGLIVDASDNITTRRHANLTAHRHGIPLVFGGAVRMEGQVASFCSGIDPLASCYDCLFPASPPAHLASNCSEAGILGPIAGIISGMMALEAIKQIFHAGKTEPILGEGLSSRLMLYDGHGLMTQIINVPKRPDCPTCGDSQKPKSSPQ